MTLDRKLKISIIIIAILTLLSVIVFASSPNASSQHPDMSLKNKDVIFLKNAHFDTTIVPTSKVPSSISNTSTDITNDYYIVQFRGHIKEEMKQSVKNTGAMFFDYVPNNAFIVNMNSSVKSQVETMDIVQWVGPYQPAYKISHVFSASSISTATTTISDEDEDDDVSNIIVMLFDSKHNAQISSEIENLGGEIVDNAGEIMRVRIGTSMLSDIASMTGVSWIEKYVQPVIFNDVAADIINVPYVQNTHGLTGSGQIVAVADTGLDTGANDATMHDDIERRIVSLYDRVGDGAGDVKSGHGTHVAGSILGNGAMSGGAFKGVAPDAQLVFQAIGDINDGLWLPIDLALLFQQAYNKNAKIHSNSWGSSESNLYGNYTSESKYVDIFMWNNPDMLIVFAAGNDGYYGVNTVSSPSTSKNVLSVGASESSRMGGNVNLIASFSSRGLTDDGRIKPDLVAPGKWIISTRSSVAPSGGLWGDYDPYYRYSGGTSMATPITAGAAALVRQYYVDNESFSPSAALIKATLINGATNMSFSTNNQGWGRVDIERSIFPTLPRTMHYYDSISLTTSQSWDVSYSVSNSYEPLRITIVWTDYPSATFVGKTLVNDLDLSVTGPDGIYLGNGGDTVNNVEQVEVSSPSLGIYTIRVNGTNIPQGPQPFALVISGGFSNGFGYVNGTVKDSVSKTGIGGIIVDTGVGITNVTDVSGFYSLLLEEGFYDLTVTGDFEYYPNSSVNIEVLPDLSIVQDIELEGKPTGTISGIVIDA